MNSYKRTVIWRTLGFIFLICLVLSNCVYFRMTHLSNEDLEWINCHKRYPTSKFISNMGNTSKLNYTSVYICNSTNPFYFNKGTSGKFEANAGYDFEILQKDTVLRGTLLIFRYVGKDSLWVMYDLNNYMSNKYLYKGQPLESNEFKMDSIVYHDCIIADSTNCIYTELWAKKIMNKIDKFVISKKYGLLYYRFQNGEEYKRQFKRKKKEE